MVPFNSVMDVEFLYQCDGRLYRHSAAEGNDLALGCLMRYGDKPGELCYGLEYINLY